MWTVGVTLKNAYNEKEKYEGIGLSVRKLPKAKAFSINIHIRSSFAYPVNCARLYLTLYIYL